MRANPVEVVVEESKYGKAERDRGLAGRRGQMGDEAEKVVQDDEEKDTGDIGLELLIAMANYRFRLLAVNSWIISAIC